MSLLLCFLCVSFLGVAGCGFQSVVAELDRSCSQPADAISRKFQVDAFIWDDRAPLALRRRYIATQACAVPALLCLAALVWLNEPRDDVRILGIIAFCSMSFIVAASLVWKIARRRA
jgi:hypothetical protein